MKYKYQVLIILLIVFISCNKSEEDVYTPYQTTAFNLSIPPHFAEKLPAPVIPNTNPLTMEGVALGKKLFYDPILSGDGTQSCATCHKIANGFSDNTAVSLGIDGLAGSRNVMPIFNLAWNVSDKFFWDGRSLGLEAQAEQPVINPIEMHNTWQNAVENLNSSTNYQELFNKAFPLQTDTNTVITKELATKAIAQFERTLISANSKYDKYIKNEITLTADELEGKAIFNDERGDCFHCHGTDDNNPLFTDNSFRNNGLDNVFTDLGLESITGNPQDKGKFKVPSLRNLAFTAPYMHDGRFATLDDVINHYSEGLVNSPTIDSQMLFIADGGTQMTVTEKMQLKAFLLTLTDNDFIVNPNFSE